MKGGDRMKKPFVIVLDGRAASGKTTMANQLAETLHAPVIHMDDFFLPPELRSPERYATPGANVHKERFVEEVLIPLAKGESIAYRRFDCGIMDYNGVVNIPESPVLIVEGSYSLHPEFGNYADMSIFVTVSPEEQMRRILQRNGAEWAEDFRNKWIPLEEAYFKAYDIPNRANIVLNNQQ